MARIDLHRRGLMLVLSSPSGAGKTTLSRLLLASEPDLAMSISVTTRPMRPGEVEGKDYYFIPQTEFIARRDRGEFLEHALVFNHYYGTPADMVEAVLKSAKDVLFDIDWQGTQQLKARAREDLVSVFILPPSQHDLQKRLTTRAQDSAEIVAGRMAKASDEMSHWPEYDYVIVNDDVETAHQQLRAILTAERLRRERQTSLPDFVKKLRNGG
ncbi:MAG: guanylate kinase [Alphaproteobacteria bacterium]|nr:guanylate kinase [Alphaproteobacteria bacterium]MDP1671235.1 guanylate kinase [Alphaproteobacteria bacterium]